MSINIGDDILDSRDIIKRIDELESEIEDLETDIENLTNEEGNFESIRDDIAAHEDETEDLQEELDVWRLFEQQCGPDWLHGEQFINDTYFEEYTEQLAGDLGLVNIDESWPKSYIDWEQAADDLKQDYMAVEVDTYTYWVRA